jgi:spore coat polysaccharide biosynthesis protein SpsF
LKTAILITARLKSTRLPMKVIKPILGRPMICHMIDRLKLAQKPDQIILCTSSISQDDLLEEIAHKEGIVCFRGDPDDVLFRLTEASGKYGVDVAINCTADNPFVDPVYIDRLLEWHIKQHYDYSITEGLPLGVFAYGLSYSAMLRACQIKDEKDTEVWGGYFTQTGLFRTGILPVTDPEVRRPNLRLTVDTPEDFEVVTKIFEALYKEGQFFTLQEIVQWCEQHPEIIKINASILQKPGIPIRIKNG